MFNLFLALWAGHMVGDFALQTGRIAEMKRVGWLGLGLHIGMVTIATFLFTFSYPFWPFIVLIVAVLHLLIDAVRTFIIRDLRRGHLLYFLADQSAHMLVLAGVASGLQPGRYTRWQDWWRIDGLHDRLALVVGMAVLLVFTVPVVEALIRLDLNPSPLESPRITARTRVLGAVERLVGYTLMTSSWAYLTPLVFVPHFLYRWWWQKNADTAQRVRPVVSLLVTVLAGWLTRVALNAA